MLPLSSDTPPIEEANSFLEGYAMLWTDLSRGKTIYTARKFNLKYKVRFCKIRKNIVVIIRK